MINSTSKNEHVNPTPITKLAVTVFLAFTLTVQIHELSALCTVLFISVFFALNGKVKSAVKTILFYCMVTAVLVNANRLNYAFVKNYVFIVFLVIKLFFLPILAGNFLIGTSDVSSLIVSFEKMRFPKVLIIPIAIMFRYFPAFREDKKNIKLAMKMRGISFANPVKYLEYVSIPLLISATNIADDISKSAETKCIADPCKKTRYREVHFRLIDFVFAAGIAAIHLIGKWYA